MDDLAAIQARANSAEDEWATRDDVRESAEDVPVLLAAVRERDNAITRVRALHQPRVNSTSALWPKPLCTCNSTYPCATIAALDPQETP